jgi:hypothetical protein
MKMSEVSSFSYGCIPSSMAQYQVDTFSDSTPKYPVHAGNHTKQTVPHSKEPESIMRSTSLISPASAKMVNLHCIQSTIQPQATLVSTTVLQHVTLYTLLLLYNNKVKEKIIIYLKIV